ncbi:MAG: 16S rRNA processing protein RimM [Proteobacteria bacterium]|jgi:16S rRNA processing protein RimM|nr:16S rRNA processing protein RimM [Pseudomonadota bacterium]
MSSSCSAEVADAIELGKVSGAWGVRGAVKVYSYTREREGIAKYTHWILKSAHSTENSTENSTERRYQVIQCRTQGQGVVATLKGVDSRDQAESLQGFGIWVPLQDLPVLPAGEYYWRQLIGLEVTTLEGVVLGKVDHLFETGANDVLVVQGEAAKGEALEVVESGDPSEPVERLLPYIDQVVVEVDLNVNSMRVDWDPEF